MSGIYIPGMEMPKRDATFLVHVNGDTIDLTPPRKYAEEYHREKTFYKLIPIQPHGDLIGRDELIENCMKEDSFLAELLFRKVSNAPTIIPADKEAVDT